MMNGFFKVSESLQRVAHMSTDVMAAFQLRLDSPIAFNLTVDRSTKLRR